MNIINQFFIAANRVKNVSEDDYKQVIPLIAACDMFTRLTYQSMYIIDFHRKNLLYVSENPFFLCGLPPIEIKEMGLAFHAGHTLQEEQNMLLEINRVGFAFFNQTPLEDRLKLTFSCDFHIHSEGETALINHKLTPAVLSGNGEMWLAACTVSLSSWQDAGHVEVRMAGKTDYWTYSPESHQWEQKDGITLKNREKEILLLSAQGLTMNEIANHLHVAIDTVKSYKQKLFQKLNVSNISEALSVAISYKMM